MATMLETPSRIWRRIEAVEERDMPSLPSLPSFDDSGEELSSSIAVPQVAVEEEDDDEDFDLSKVSAPIHSTPTVSSHYMSTVRAASSTSSTARFASSLARSSVRSSVGHSLARAMSAEQSHPESFDISAIPSLPNITTGNLTGHYSEEIDIEEDRSKESVPEVYLPPKEEEGDAVDEFSLSDALESVSRTSSPYTGPPQATPKTTKSQFDYSVGLKSERKPSPVDKYRNVAMRRPLSRTRTPSLTHTSTSSLSSSANSTPRSTRSLAMDRSAANSPVPAASIPLPPSNVASPIVGHESEEEEVNHEPSFGEGDTRSSMDITEAHISPLKDNGTDSEEDLGRSEVTGGDASHEDAREPTFSSEGSQSPYGQKSTGSAGGLASVFSSPAQSMAATPTPAFPRPRARFNLATVVAASSNVPATPAQQTDGPLTPHTRRKSFLLSVINSTTRPRLRYPTPHPRNEVTYPDSPITEAETETETTPGPVVPTKNLQTAFAGVNLRPRMRGRLSHPLAQAYTAPSSDSDSPGSNGLQTHEGASFVSTASSHDLTAHPRANTSFDPSMGFGLGAQGAVGRFNAGKLNNYLHGLNRRLQEENEVLVERVKQLEEERQEEEGGVGRASASLTATNASSRRWSVGSNRRISAGGTALGNVKEDVSGEGWVEEKAELENMIATLKKEKAEIENIADAFKDEKAELEAMLETFKDEMTTSMAEKEDAERALNQERQDRARDKERWKDRMAEVEEGVQTIVEDLEQKMQSAEKRAAAAETAQSHKLDDLQRHLEEAEEERHLANERAAKAEQALASGQDLGDELRSANQRITTLMADLRNANGQIRQLEDAVLHADERIDELERVLKEEKDLVTDLDQELSSATKALDAEREKTQEIEKSSRNATKELEATSAYVTELEGEVNTATERLRTLEHELDEAHRQAQELKASEDEAYERAESLETEIQRSSELARQMEDALEAAEAKMQSDEETAAELRGKVASLEKERDRLRDAANRSRDPSQIAPPLDADVDALEEELDQANREIARLQAVIAQSPARKAIDKAKDTKIEILEKENEDLLERVKALRATVMETGTPSKIINNSGISPMARHALAMSIRAPKTPGGPLRDMSWLNTPGGLDPSVSPLVAEIERLQRELDRANDSIDDKLDKLEDAGLGVVGLTRKLEDARAKIIALEDEIARLTRREDRRSRRLERARCQKCLTKFNLQNVEADETSMEIRHDSLPTEPPTPPTKTSNALRADIENVNSHLTSLKKQWQEEKRQLVGEKNVLQEATNRLSTQVREAKAESNRVAELQAAGQKSRADVQGDLENAKRTIAELEEDLKSERARLRSMLTEQSRIAREKEDILHQLQRTESDMDGVKEQLQKCKKENHDMENELRVNINAEQKARLLEARVAENTDVMEQLREERSLLVADHKDLQKRYAEISEHANRLREEYAASQTSHDNRRHQLDLHLNEIDELRKALSEQAEELHRTEAEKNRITAERSDVARTVATLEADLHRVRKDAEAFGRDLKLLRSEKERMEAKQREELSKAERTKKQAQAQIRLLNEQLEGQRAKTLRAIEQLEQHICAMDENQLSAMKLQHNKECKGLVVQIRYLKAKFTRESSLRFALVYQKDYLLILLAQLQNTEQTMFAAIAKIGFPIRPTVQAKKGRRLKSVATLIIFVHRLRTASEFWRTQCASKPAIAAALQDVRRKRVHAS